LSFITQKNTCIHSIVRWTSADRWIYGSLINNQSTH